MTTDARAAATDRESVDGEDLAASATATLTGQESEEGVESLVRPRASRQEEAPGTGGAPAGAARGGFIKHYEIIRTLGEGGMGVVLLARDTKLGRLVAVKLLHERGRAAARLLAEAQATARARHENIVVLYEAGEVDGRPFMVLEYIEGRTLREVMAASRRAEGRALPRGRALEIMTAALRALAAAHRIGVVHGDLKPENVMLLDAGQVKVLDFGIAGRIGAGERASRAGTRPYMSPEQWAGLDIDARSDLWAAGVLLYELLAGAHPLAPLSHARLERVADPDAPMPSLREARPELGGLADVVDRCLRKRREERFGSAEELCAALEPWLDLDERAAAALAEGESPFAGLAAFQESDAGRFFGRAGDVAAATGWLGRRALVAVAGPSGAGKSSFVRAGLIPALRRSGEAWEVLVVRPGRAPLAALREALGPEGDASDLRAEPGLLGTRLRARCRARGPSQRLLVFVDQFEELYTLAQDPAERAAFLACLLGAADDESSPLRVVITVRSDFLDRIVEDRPFMARVSAGLLFLPQVGPEGLREALARPVEAAGYRYEDEALIEEMLEELSRARSPLPLLQFAAAALWEARDRERRLLTRRSHQRLGGVAGALAAHADAVVAALPAADQRLCRAIFLRLVTPERTRAVVAMGELAGLSEDGAALDAVVRHLCQARLLLLDTDVEPGSARVELVHESLIERWPTLARWLGESAEDAQLLARLRAAASQWAAAGGPSGLLWRDRAAEEARAWYERRRADEAAERGAPLGERLGERLGDVERRYLLAVIALLERGRRSRRRLTAGAFALLGAVVAVVVVLALRARDQARRADEGAARVREQNAELASQALRGRNATRMLAARKRQDDPTLVLALLREIEPEDIPRDWPLLVSEALSSGVARAERLIDKVNPAYMASVSPDGGRVVLAMNDGTARILGAEDLEERLALRGHQAHLWTAAWSPDGERVVTASGDGTARIWSADGSTEPLVLRGHRAALSSAVMSPDGERVVTASDDGTARVWSARDGAGLAVLRHDAEVHCADISPDGRRVVTAAADGIARVWNADGEGRPLLLRGHQGMISTAAWSPDGARIATGGMDRTVRIWDARSGAELLALRGHEDRVMSVAWGPRGARVASASKDRTARVWNAGGGGWWDAEPIVLRGHGHWVYTARFSPDGRRLVTVSLDRTVRVWDLDGLTRPVALHGHERTTTYVSWSPDGEHLATAADRTARIWDLQGAREPVVLRGHAAMVRRIRWSPDGARVVTASFDGTARIWSVEGSTAPIVLRGHEDDVIDVAWSPGGDRLVTASRDGTLRLWDGHGAELARVTRRKLERQADIHVEFDRGGERVAVHDDHHHTFHLWDVGGAGGLAALGRHDGTVGSLQWSPDGSRLLTASWDGTARIWDARGEAAPVVLRADGAAFMNAAWSPGGDRIAAALGDGTVRIWNARGGVEPLVFAGHVDRLVGIGWSPDGTRVIAGSSDAATGVWNADGSGVPFILVGVRAYAGDPYWSPDGQRIAVRSDEKVIRIWPEVRPFTGPGDARLWAATSYCIPAATRVELLGVTEAEAREAEDACRRRVRDVDQARAARGHTPWPVQRGAQ